jgi:hypothetical protein
MVRAVKKWLLVLALLLPSAAFGQNFAAPTSTVVDGTGHPVAGATVTVCSGALALPPPGTVCSPATTIFSNFAGAAQANPFTTDGFGNWPFFAPSANYLVSISGGPLIAYSFYLTVPCAAVTGCVGVGGTANFLWGSPIANALTLNSPASSCPSVASCVVLVITNTNAANPLYVTKGADGSFCFQNDANSIESHGQFCFTANGTLQILGGSGGAQVQFPTVAGGFPSGSVLFQLPDGGVGTAVLALNAPGNVGEGAYEWDTNGGVSRWYPINSATATVTLTPPAAGATPTAVPLELTATSSPFATATTAGTCVQNTTAVTGATTSMAVAISPVSTPGVGSVWSAFVSSAGNVTINECAVATSAGGSIAFNIRVIE